MTSYTGRFLSCAAHFSAIYAGGFLSYASHFSHMLHISLLCFTSLSYASHFSPTLVDLSPTLAKFLFYLYYCGYLVVILWNSESPSTEQKYDCRKENRKRPRGGGGQWGMVQVVK